MGKHFENQVKSTPISENNETFATIHGYARCSTSDSKQDIDRQVRELKAAGATRIWMEYEHGDAAVKDQQEAMLEATKRPGVKFCVSDFRQSQEWRWKTGRILAWIP